MAKRKTTKQTVPTYTVERAALGIHHIAAQDESRPVLSGVRVYKGRLIAADGFMLATVEQPGVADADLILPGADLARLRSRTTDKLPTAEIEPHKDRWLATGSAKPGEPVSMEAIDGTYPNVDQIFDGAAEDGIAASVVLNAGLLKQVMAWLAGVAEHEAVQFRIPRGDHKAVEFRAVTAGENRRVRGLIMPMLMQGPSTVGGAWFREGLTPPEEAEATEVDEWEAVTA